MRWSIFYKKRIMNNNAQTLYDLSIATLNFLENAQFVDKSVKRKALKKNYCSLFFVEKENE